jgi:hypothetical protein
MTAITEIENRALAVQPEIVEGPMANAIAALKAGMTIEQMQGLMALQKDWEANEARKAYVANMASFKLNPPEIYKTKLVSFSGTQYMHATLGDVSKAVVEALASHGFSHGWEMIQSGGVIKVICKITHRLGHSEFTSMEGAADQSGKKNAIQAVASTVTYMQRYTLLAACGLATMDIVDDDGCGGQGQAPIGYDANQMLTEWTARAEAAPTLEALRITRGAAADAFLKANDSASWNIFKTICANKKSAFEGIPS